MHEGTSTAARQDSDRKPSETVRRGRRGMTVRALSAGALIQVVQHPGERRPATGIAVRRRRTVVVDPRPAGEVFEPGASRV